MISATDCTDFDYLQATQEVVSQLPLTTNEEFKAAVHAAKKAFPSWRNTPVTTRQRIMFKLQQLIRRDIVSMSQYVSISSVSLAHVLQLMECCVISTSG